MRDELDALRRAVDEATSEVIAAECALEEARGIERVATAGRQTAEGARNAAVAKLTEARAVLDARLGIRLVSQPLPTRATVGAGVLTASTTPAPAVPEWEDDDDPVRG
jgi:hypothetical protein